MRDKLIEILREPIPVIRGYDVVGESRMSIVDAERYADRLLVNGAIVLPCKVGDITYHLINIETNDGLNVAAIHKGTVCSISKDEKTLCIFGRYDNGLRFWCTEKDIGEKLFFVREEAEQALKGERNAEIH